MLSILQDPLDFIKNKVTMLLNSLIMGNYPIGNMYIDVDGDGQLIKYSKLNALYYYKNISEDSLTRLTNINTTLNFKKPNKNIWHHAVLGYTQAQYLVGLWYKNGEGVEKDHTVAKYWFNKAAKGSHLGAIMELSILN